MANEAGATRSSRSSTLPSQQSARPKHRYQHRQHQSTSHKSGHTSRFHTETKTHSESTSSHASPLSPLGELLHPVKRNVTDGLNGVAGWASKSLSHDGTVESKRQAVEIWEVERSRQQRKLAERSVEEQYNTLAAQTAEQHAILAESRANAMRTFSRLDSTLSSLSQLQHEAKALLQILAQESIPELTEESTKQLNQFQATITDMETTRITALQTRVDVARETTNKLGDRMIQVKDRIRVWEEKEAEDDRRRRRRVGFVWGTIAVMLVMIVLLLIWGRMNERLEAQEDLARDWTEIVIEKERNRTGNGTELAMEQLLRSLKEDDYHGGDYPQQKLPGEEAASESDDGRLSKIFDEL